MHAIRSREQARQRGHDIATIRKTTWAAGLALATAIASPPASADRVTLANGDRLSGKVLGLTADKLTLETAYAGKLEIDRRRIAAIETDGEVQVMLEGERQVRGARGTLPLARLAFVNPSPEQSGIGVAYTGRVTLSSAHVRGNATSSTTLSEAALQARARPYRWQVELSATRASESGAESASSALAQASYDRFVAPKRFFYGRVSLERDRFAGIALRSTAGGGYGVQLREDERTRLSLRGGAELVSLDPLEGAVDRYPALGWGVRYSQWVLDRRAELFHDQDGFWNLRDTDGLTLRSRSGIRVPVAGGLTASGQLNVDWENSPEPGRESTDSTLLLGLGYRW